MNRFLAGLCLALACSLHAHAYSNIQEVPAEQVQFPASAGYRVIDAASSNAFQVFLDFDQYIDDLVDWGATAALLLEQVTTNATAISNCLTAVEDDTSPVLGGALDGGEYNISNVSNINILGTYSVGGVPIDTAGGIDNVVEDTTPELGGDLDGGGFDVSGVADMNITGDYRVNGVLLDFMEDLVDDLTPGLGGTLDASGESITNATNIDITGEYRVNGVALNLSGLGIQSVSNDPSPTLGGDLDGDGNDITNAANVYVTGLFYTNGVALDFTPGSGGMDELVDDTTPVLGGDLDGDGNDISNAANVYVTGLFYTNGVALDFAPGSGGLDNVVEDTTPELGGDLDADGNDITGVADLYVTGASRYGDVADAEIAADAYGAVQRGAGEYMYIGASAYGAAQYLYVSDWGTNTSATIGSAAIGSVQRGAVGSGAEISIGTATYGAGQYGYFEAGATTIGDEAHGAQQRGRLSGYATIGDGAYGSVQFGDCSEGNAAVTNLGVGSIQLLGGGTMSGTGMITTNGNASIGLGECVVSNNQAIVAGDGQVSHGDGTISASGGFYENGVKITGGSGTSVTNSAGTTITLANTSTMTEIETEVPTSGAVIRYGDANWSGGGGGGGGFPIPCGPWHKADFSAAAGNSPAFISISDGAGGLMYGRELGHTSNSKTPWADSYVATGGVLVIRTPLGWETDISANVWDAVLGICYGNGLTPFDYVTNAAASFSHTNTAAYTIGNDIEWGRWTNNVGSGFFRFVLDKGDTPSANDSLILFGNPSISVE